MRWLKQIHIRNFQSHEDTTIKLSPGINAITGPTDAGKSAVLRALRWAAWNITPDGGWIRQGCSYVSVELTMSDGAVITRERRGNRNRYLIALPGAEPLVLEGFGLKCPEEVLRAHGMRPVPFSADKPTLLNFASQHEAPFFLSETAPERARILGRLAGVHVIDYAIRGANRDVQQQSREVSRLEADLADVEQDLETYAGLEAEEQRVARAERMLAQAVEATERLDKLSGVAARLGDVRRQQQETRQTLSRLRNVDAAAAAIMQATVIAERVGRITDVVTHLGRVQGEQAETRKVLDRLRYLDAAERAVAQAETQTARVDMLTRHRVQLNGTREQLAQVRAALHVAIRASKAEGSLTGAAQVQERLQRLSTLSTTYQTTLQQLRATQRILAAADQAMAAGFRLENATLAADRLARLTSHRDQLQRIRREMAAVDDVLTTVQDAGAAWAALQAAEEAERRRDALQGHYYTLVELRGRMEKGRGVLAALAQQMQAAAQAYGAALQEAGVCPTCLQKIDPQTAARIAAGLQNGKGEHSHVA